MKSRLREQRLQTVVDIVNDFSQLRQAAQDDPNALRIIDAEVLEYFQKIKQHAQQRRGAPLHETLATVDQSADHDLFDQTIAMDTVSVIKSIKQGTQKFAIPVRGGKKFLAHIISCPWCLEFICNSINQS